VGNSTKTGLIVAALTGVGIGLISVIKRKGVQNTVDDLKTGTAKAVEAVMESSVGQAIATVINKIGSQPGANDDGADDETGRLVA
jgi:hypothetical protein